MGGDEWWTGVKFRQKAIYGYIDIILIEENPYFIGTLLWIQI